MRGELLYGPQLEDGAHRLAEVIDQFLLRVQCLPWDDAAAAHFASIAAELYKSGTPTVSMDAMVAGHAMSIGAVLVTNNGRHFSRVAGLAVENWCQEQ